MLQWAYFKDKNVVPPKRNQSILHPYFSIAAISRELPLFPALKINLYLKQTKKKLSSYLKDKLFFFQTSMGEKSLRVSPWVLNPRPCTRKLCKCVTPGQGGLWLWVKQLFSFICVCSCYWWPSLAPATMSQQYYSQTSTNGHKFIAAAFSVSFQPTVHTFTPILTFLQRQRPPKHVPNYQNDLSTATS